MLMSSVVRRNMKPSPRFVVAAASDEKAHEVSGLLEEGESLVGWYTNPVPWEREVVVFSDRAMYVRTPTGTQRIAWQEITDYELPKSKTTVDGVRVRMGDRFVFVRMAGSHGPDGKFKDAFQLTMVLQLLVNRRRGRTW